MLDFTEYTKMFISLFAVLDPVGIIPVVIAFTMGMNTRQQARISSMASLSMCGILVVALLVGEFVLEFFGISIHSFRTAGGIILLMMSFSMLTGMKEERQEMAQGEDVSTLAIVPLSTPLLAGPGAISTVILDAHKGHGVWHYAIMVLVLVLLSLTVWLTFRAAPWVEARLGKTGIHIVTRVMGLILAAIAVEFITGGLRALLPGLA